MTASAFLVQLAQKLEHGPADVAEFKTWALLCRDYACLALQQEQPVIPKVFVLWKTRRRRDSQDVAATTSVDAAT